MEGTNVVSPATPVVLEWKSESIAALADALAKAQTEFGPILKKVENAAFMRNGKASKYADLAAVIEATQPALSKHGLSIIQMPNVNIQDKSMTLTGVMAHSSGEWIKSSLTLPAVQRDKFDPQSCCSSITYGRRYQYTSMIGAAAEDDDGNAASGVGSTAAAQAVAERKIAEHKATEIKPKILQLSVIPVEGGESRLEGEGVPRLLKALDETDPHFKATFMRYDQGEMLFYVKTAKAFVLVDICTSVGVNAVLAEARPVTEPFVPSDEDFPPILQPEGMVITALSTHKAKALDKGGNDQYLQLTWDGQKWNVATWFHGMFPLLTECFSKQIPVKLLTQESGKFKNVVGIEGAEKGQDGVYRFPVQR